MRTSTQHLSAVLLAFALALSTAAAVPYKMPVADVSVMAPAPAPAADVVTAMTCEELIFTLFEHCTTGFGVPVSDAKNDECCHLSRKANMGGCYCDAELIEASKDMGILATSIEATLLYCGVPETDIDVYGVAGCDLPVAAPPMPGPEISVPAPAPLPSTPVAEAPAPIPMVVVEEATPPTPMEETGPPHKYPTTMEEAGPAPEYEDVVSAPPPCTKTKDTSSYVPSPPPPSPLPCNSYKMRGVRH